MLFGHLDVVYMANPAYDVTKITDNYKLTANYFKSKYFKK
jgi:hypothetical protein